MADMTDADEAFVNMLTSAQPPSTVGEESQIIPDGSSYQRKEVSSDCRSEFLNTDAVPVPSSPVSPDSSPGVVPDGLCTQHIEEADNLNYLGLSGSSLLSPDTSTLRCPTSVIDFRPAGSLTVEEKEKGDMVSEESSDDPTSPSSTCNDPSNSHLTFELGSEIVELPESFAMIRLELDILRICAEVLNCHLCLQIFSDSRSFMKHMTTHGFPTQFDFPSLQKAVQDGQQIGMMGGDQLNAPTRASSAESEVLERRAKKYKSRPSMDHPGETTFKIKRTSKSKQSKAKPPLGASFLSEQPSFGSDGGNNISSMTLNSEDDEDEIMEYTSSSAQHSCTCCEASFSTRKQLSEHRRTFIHKCDMCGKEYANPRSFLRHKLLHSDPKPFKCNECNKGFTRAAGLRDHVRMHTGETPYVCNICRLKLGSKGALKTHQLLHTETGRPRPFKCQDCAKSFPTMVNLVMHTRSHTGEKPFECEICEVKCASRSSLNSHMRTHSDVKPFVCNVCGVSVKTSNTLAQHKRAFHSTTKPFNCDLCRAGFIKRSQLTQHMRKHTGERPFLCDVCGKGFITKHMLKIHRNIHAGIKPYQCDHCGAIFSQSSTLKTHMNTHTGEKPYVCEICPTKFACRAGLRSHIQAHHKSQVGFSMQRL